MKLFSGIKSKKLELKQAYFRIFNKYSNRSKAWHSNDRLCSSGKLSRILTQYTRIGNLKGPFMNDVTEKGEGS